MSSYAPAAGILAASGLLAFSFGHGSMAGTLGAAFALVFTLASACVLFCLFVQLIGSARQRPALFWGAQVAVLLCTSAGTSVSIALPRIGSTAQTDPVMASCFTATYFILIYLALFQRLWGEVGPQHPQGDAGQAPGTAGSSYDGAAAPTETMGAAASRCAELAEQHGLTRREREVLELMARGWTVDMVARQLVVSPQTARTHLKHLYAKLGVHSRTELLDAAGTGTPELEP